jgi:hypothetical protein
VAGFVVGEDQQVIKRVNDWVRLQLSNPATRSALYKFALAVSTFLAAKYAIDGSLMAIVNGALAVLFGVADANVSYEPEPEPEPGYPDAPYMIG